MKRKKWMEKWNYRQQSADIIPDCCLTCKYRKRGVANPTKHFCSYDLRYFVLPDDFGICKHFERDRKFKQYKEKGENNDNR